MPRGGRGPGTGVRGGLRFFAIGSSGAYAQPAPDQGEKTALLPQIPAFSPFPPVLAHKWALGKWFSNMGKWFSHMEKWFFPLAERFCKLVWAVSQACGRAWLP